MSKFIVTFVLLVCAGFSSAATIEEENHTGIWQAQGDFSDFGYFIIQEKMGQVVVIALAGIEQSGDTLRFSYVGDTESYIVSRLTDDLDFYYRLRLEFKSPEDGVVYPYCATCNTAIVVQIKRVF
ncbi:MAG: hypothetical protein LBE21_05150 [Pseudomonadales bacterium]|nr:hypothetical protein [Pseudomonadales bacterium]